MPIRTLLRAWNICKSGTKSSKTNHTLCCNTVLLQLQDLRLLKWPPGMQSRREEIRDGYVRKCGLPLSGSHSESHPKCRTFPGFYHHTVARRVAAYKNFGLRKFSSFPETFIQSLKSRIAMILSSTSCFCKLNEYQITFSDLQLWSMLFSDDLQSLLTRHISTVFGRTSPPPKRKNDLFFLANYSITYI